MLFNIHRNVLLVTIRYYIKAKLGSFTYNTNFYLAIKFFDFK